LGLLGLPIVLQDWGVRRAVSAGIKAAIAHHEGHYADFRIMPRYTLKASQAMRRQQMMSAYCREAVYIGAKQSTSAE
jgi:hypothetical protein